VLLPLGVLVGVLKLLLVGVLLVLLVELVDVGESVEMTKVFWGSPKPSVGISSMTVLPLASMAVLVRSWERILVEREEQATQKEAESARVAVKPAKVMPG